MHSCKDRMQAAKQHGILGGSSQCDRSVTGVTGNCLGVPGNHLQGCSWPAVTIFHPARCNMQLAALQLVPRWQVHLVGLSRCKWCRCVLLSYFKCNEAACSGGVLHIASTSFVPLLSTQPNGDA